jgi:hypothetical protein
MGIKTMQAYLNDPSLKEKILQQLQQHYDADEIIKGVYWENGKGCAIGCILHDQNGNHWRFESELGIPMILAELIDGLFEALPNAVAKEWPLKIMSTFETGRDYSNVWYKFVIWLLIDEQEGIIRFSKNDNTRKVILTIVNAHQKYLQSSPVTSDEWLQIAEAARVSATALDSQSGEQAVYIEHVVYAYARAQAYAPYADFYAFYAFSAAASAFFASSQSPFFGDESYFIKISNKLINLIEEQL